MNQLKKMTLVVFLLVAGIYTATLNSWNAKYFGLQAATVAALTERGKFELVDHVLPDFKLAEGDETFRYNNKIYPMKQPGQTVLGSMVYIPLMFAGFYMLNHYDYAVHIITFFTSTLMMASLAAMIYLVARWVSKDQRTALITTLTASFGTIIWAYAGVMHHDIEATFFIAMGIASYFYYLYREKRDTYLLLGGLSLGIALFFSMLPVTIPLTLLLIITFRKKVKEIVLSTVGLLIGLIPSFIFNYTQFGNPLAFPNLAGRVVDTVPFWSISNLLSHLYFYLLSPTYSLAIYSPVLIFGLVGLWLMPRSYKEARLVLLWLPAILLLHISTQATYGGYQYGPRYLLPALPMLSLGIPFFLMKIKNKYWRTAFYITLIYSVVVAGTGAVQTAMFPVSSSPVFHPAQFGPWENLKSILTGNLPQFRMLPIGVLLIALAGIIWLSEKLNVTGRLRERLRT